jgi:hypothetical protein
VKKEIRRTTTLRKSAQASAFKYSKPSTVAGNYVHQHYQVPASIADLIANLAGLGGNRESLL